MSEFMLSSSHPPTLRYYGEMSSSPNANSLRAFPRDGSEKHLGDILSKLKFIAMIKPNEIVDTRSMSLMEAGWITSAYRTIIGRTEGRDTTLEMFKNVVDSALDLAELYSINEERMFKDIGITLIDAIRQSKTGISNHAKTYESDTMFIAKTEAFLKTINIRLEELIRKIARMSNGETPAIPIPHHHNSHFQPSTYPPSHFT